MSEYVLKIGGRDYRARVEEITAARADENPDAEWILGGVFPAAMFPGDNPNRQLLDDIIPDRPVCIADQSAHSWWCNTRALEMTGLMESNADLPEGAVIERDANGVPSGTVREHAIGYMRQFIPPKPHDEWVAVARGFTEWFNRLGITSTQLAAGNEAHLKAAKELADSGDLSVRLVVALNYGYFDSAESVPMILMEFLLAPTVPSEPSP